MDTVLLDDYRCKCGKLLLRGVFFEGTLEIKCRRCGTINKIGQIKPADDPRHYLLVINDQGLIVNASDSAGRVLGYAHEELLGKSFIQINPSMPQEIGQKFFGAGSVLSEESNFQLDTVHQAKDGTKIPVTVLLKLYKPINQERYVLVSVESRKARNGDGSVARDAPQFVDNACDFYFCIDKNGVNEYISPSAEKLFGFSPEMVMGKNYFSYLPAETREESRGTFEHFSAEGRPYRVPHDIRTGADGEVVHSELYFTPQFDDSGKFRGYRVLGWVLKDRLVHA